MRGGAESPAGSPSPHISPRGLAKPGLRATASLNRVLDNARNATKRRSLFGSAVLSHASDTSDFPQGPDAFDDSSISTTSSSKQPSFSSTRTRARAKLSSDQPSPLNKNARESAEVGRSSNESDYSNDWVDSPLPVGLPKYSPPPSIHFDLQATTFLDPQLMEAVGLTQAEFAAAMNAIPTSPTESTLHQTYGQAGASASTHQVYLPSRNTTDHWRTSQARLGYLASPDTAAQEHSRTGYHLQTKRSILNLDELLKRASKTPPDGRSDNGSRNTSISTDSILLHADASPDGCARTVPKGRNEPLEHAGSAKSCHASMMIKPRKSTSSFRTLSTSPSTDPANISPGYASRPCADATLSNTPSPGRPLRLPIRTKLPLFIRSMKEATDENTPPPDAPISPSWKKSRKTPLGIKRMPRKSSGSVDEVMSPLLTQDLFKAESDNEDSSAYALELNDLVEQATRDESPPYGRYDGEDVCQSQATGVMNKASQEMQPALNTLTDLKRLRPFRELHLRNALQHAESPRQSEQMQERSSLEREALDAVFPREEKGETCNEAMQEAMPILEGSSDKDLEQRVYDLFFNDVEESTASQSATVQGSLEDGEGDACKAATSGVSSPDSACFIPVCRVCGGDDDHVCDMTLSPSRIGVQNISSPQSTRMAESQRGSAMGPDDSSEQLGVYDSAWNVEVDSQQQKKAELVGLELHRLGNQAAGWLQGLSPNSMKHFMSGKTTTDGTLRVRQAAWKWAKLTNQDEPNDSSPKRRKTVAEMTGARGSCERAEMHGAFGTLESAEERRGETREAVRAEMMSWL